MNNNTKTIILATAVAALAALLLAGCQRSDQKGPAKTAIQSGKEPADSLWKVLHGGMSRWESDK